MLLAESIEPGKTTATWTIRLKPGLDVPQRQAGHRRRRHLLIQRIIDPKDPKVGAAAIGYIDPQVAQEGGRAHRAAHAASSRTRPSRTTLGQYFNAIVPTDYDPKNPVGTGPFKYE